MSKLNFSAIETLMLGGLVLFVFMPALLAITCGAILYVILYMGTALIAEFILPHLGDMKTVKGIVPRLSRMYREAHWIVLGLFLAVWVVHRLRGEFPVWALLAVIVGHVVISWSHKIELRIHKKQAAEDPTNDGYRSVRD